MVPVLLLQERFPSFEDPLPLLLRYMEATGGNRLSERMIYEMEQKRKEFKDIWSCQRSVWKSYPDLTEYGLMMANLFKIGKIPW
ncbi:hypothetical protein OIU85_021581 [Salix viminalis]|uniref:Uncharacterized protein n=1 Tax=Salix viminalis TaxID=40686 RepID=A0A9Q0UIV7_SALVM|nr:hypothetical protein OIU85_021581 [Salix viminalis]